MKNSDYIVFDFETGGLKPDKNPAIQIALLTLDGKTLKELHRWETYILPYDNLVVEKAALNANGLRMSDVNSLGIPKPELIKKLKEYFLLTNPRNAPMKKPILVGHNIEFDMGFLNYIFKDEKLKVDHYISYYKGDTYAEALRAFPNESVHKLGAICGLVGIELTDAHKAMNDVVATAELFKYFTKKLRVKKGESNTGENKGEIQGKSRLTFQF